MISGNTIDDEGVAHIAKALQTNTTMKVLDVAECDITDKGVESLSRALAASSSLEKLGISSNFLGDNGIAHIAIALQANTTMKVLHVADCGMSCKGAESLGRALTASSSLEELDIGLNHIGNNGIAHITIALLASNTLKSLMSYDDTVTDKAVLSLTAGLTTNTSMEVMDLGWTSTHPDTTLREMAECINKSTLRKLILYITDPQLCGEPQLSMEESREWHRCVKIGAKDIILSVEDSRLESFSLNIEPSTCIQDLKSQIT